VLLSTPHVLPAALGVRDSLRLESGMCLYGHDLNETITPIEASLNWLISKRRREAGGFPGAEVIQKQLKEGVTRSVDLREAVVDCVRLERSRSWLSVCSLWMLVIAHRCYCCSFRLCLCIFSLPPPASASV
jgi:glycine cleavage system aminomethyltransferase T